MGNSSTKEARNGDASDSGAASSSRHPERQNGTGGQHAPRPSRGRNDTGAPPLDAAAAALEPRRETRQERDARKAAKERANRAKERERSLREESVDGGYLVTLGTYTGPEDFSKSTVRQLMIERRVAPFWRGLDNHSDSWTEHQLVAAARGLPIPAADEVPPEQPPPGVGPSSEPIPIRADTARPAYAASPAQHSPHIGSVSGSLAASSPLFRGRSKTLASLASKDSSPADLAPQEVRLPHEPQINGQPVEAYLYKDVGECPICFLYYPPWLNRTRCCDQFICTECFVQIKRPDPHPPEHLDPNSPVPEDIRKQEEEGQLVSEPAQCPFCKQDEFGVTYEPPPFRRGLAYANHAFSKNASHMASSPSVPAGAGPLRRRGQSISATAPSVITTDRVRPDWATKLSEARANASRRAAAATALHTAAYMMGGNEGRLGLGRRRRPLMMDVDGAHDGVPLPNLELLMAALADQSATRAARSASVASHGRSGGRAGRAEELEELMIMEAIRQSLAAEDERKRREDKEAKKEEKARAKDQKKADKAAKKAGSSGLYSASYNASSVFPGPSSMTPDHSTEAAAKGKQRADMGDGTPDSVADDPHRHGSLMTVLHAMGRRRGLSSASSSGSASSAGARSSNSAMAPEAANGNGSAGTPTDPAFNFGSLAAMIDQEDARLAGADAAADALPETTASKAAVAGDGDSVGPSVSLTTTNRSDARNYAGLDVFEHLGADKP